MKKNSRKPLLVDNTLSGWDYAKQHSLVTDEFFESIIADSSLDTEHLALVGVGSYGRQELCPYSDIDVLLLHEEGVDARRAAEALWYPLWDRGLKIGYSVVTLRQAEQLALEEFQWATAMLDSRLVIGSSSLFSELEQMTQSLWSVHRESLMKQLFSSVQDRGKNHGSVAFRIEPDVKHGRGGLRDIHTMRWASKDYPAFTENYIDELVLDIEVVLKARVELHRLNGRPGDILTFDAQDSVAGVLGEKTSKDFMRKLTKAGRRIAWYSDEAWARWNRSTRTLSLAGLDSIDFSVLEDLKLFTSHDGVLKVKPMLDLRNQPYAIIKFARLAAESELVMGRQSLAIFKDEDLELPSPWTDEARADFVALFLCGRSSIRTIEDLDHFGLMSKILPEWSAVRCAPQRNVLHKFTVDRHLCETAVKAAELSSRVRRPDLLIVGALLHDIGKGYPGDHTEVGVELIGEIGERMGYCEDDVAILVDLCRFHLLLADVATRRDLSDPGTIASVSAAVQNVDFLELLAVLTEADSISTGPSAWGSWKSGLLAQLVDRTKFVLEGGVPEEAALTMFPSPEIRELMDSGEFSIKGKDEGVTVVAPNIVNVFGIVAGVLALSGLQVLRAHDTTEVLIAADGTQGFSTACRFRVQGRSWGKVDWPEIEETIKEALQGRVAIQARIAMRVGEELKRKKRLSAEPPRKEVLFDNDTSEFATIVEVYSADIIGLLYKVTQVLTELYLDVKSARVQTFGPQKVSSFYLCDRDGSKVEDQALLDEISIAINQVLE